jgi:hypothetical protein
MTKNRPPLKSPSIARDAYAAALAYLEQNQTLKDCEKRMLSQATSIEDVQLIVQESLGKYLDKQDSSKTRKWLRKTAETVSHYDSVLDTFVQHHPEYVALVWGLMKLLFMVCFRQIHKLFGNMITHAG